MHISPLPLLLPVLSLLFLCCIDDGNRVLDAGPVAGFTAAPGVYISDGHAVSRYSFDSDGADAVYTADSGVSIVDFDVHDLTDALVLVTDQRSAQHLDNNRHTNRIEKLSPQGTDTLYTKTTDGWESLENLARLRISPDGRSAAVEVYQCSYGGIAALVFGADSLTHSRGEAGMDDMAIEFLVWDPGSQVFYARFAGALVRCDLGGTNTFLSSPNIRDYVSTADLLAQGYLGERFDYGPHIGLDDPRLVCWSPNGGRFVYLHGDSVFLYNRTAQTRRFIRTLADTTLADRRVKVVWADEDQPPPYDNSAFTDSDLLTAFDSTVLDTFLPMNPSFVEYKVGKVHECVSTVWVTVAQSWNASHPYPQYHVFGFDAYTLKRPIDRSVFTMLESEFVALLFGQLCNRPVDGYRDSTQAFLDSLLASYDSVIAESESFYAQFRVCATDESVRPLIDSIDTKIARVIRYHRSLRELWATQDTASYADSLHAIFGDENRTLIDTVLSGFHDDAATLDYFTALATAGRRIHNELLNVFGWDEVLRMKQLLVDQGIEPVAGSIRTTL